MAQKIVIDSKAQAVKREQEGYSYQQERGFDVAEKVAQNESVSQFTNMGVGLGTMAGVSGALGGMVGSNVREAVSEAGLLSEEEFKSMKEKLLSDIL